MKNDLVDLFRWNKQVDIKDKDKNVVATVFIRLVGDIDYNQAQQHALLISRKLRKALKNTDSMEHQSLFLDIDDRNRDDLTLGVLLSEMSNFRDMAVAELGDIFKVSELSLNPTLEDKEQHQEAEEKLVQDKFDKIKSKMEEISNKRKLELEVLPTEDLKKLFIDSNINMKCIEEFSEAFRDYCVFAGTYKDQEFKTKVFIGFDDYRNTSPNLKKQLLDAYLELEISGEQLKN